MSEVAVEVVDVCADVGETVVYTVSVATGRGGSDVALAEPFVLGVVLNIVVIKSPVLDVVLIAMAAESSVPDVVLSTVVTELFASGSAVVAVVRIAIGVPLTTIWLIAVSPPVLPIKPAVPLTIILEETAMRIYSIATSPQFAGKLTLSNA